MGWTSLRALLLFAAPCLQALALLCGEPSVKVLAEHSALLLLLGTMSVLSLAVDHARRKRRPRLADFFLLCMALYTSQAFALLIARLLPLSAGLVPRAAIGEREHVDLGGVLAPTGPHHTTSNMYLHHRAVVDSGTSGWELHTNFGGVLASVGKTLRTITVVLPCANEPYAARTVERFCERTPSELLQEIIVVDDGSVPSMAEHLRQHPSRPDLNPQCKVKILRHELRYGLMYAKLTGGKAASGDVIAFIDCHCSPQAGWHREVLDKLNENPRRLVVPSITDLDLDTFDEREHSSVASKCYLTLDADFKWFESGSDYVPAISGGLVVVGREWFNLTGGFDEVMRGWGIENLDQSVRSWLCGGDIVRARSSRIAHMWRTGDHRTSSRVGGRSAGGANNRGRFVNAWFGPFLRVSPQIGRELNEDLSTYQRVQQRLACRPLSYLFYRFRRVYVESGVLGHESFLLREKSSGLCLNIHDFSLSPCGNALQKVQRSNLDMTTQKCCSGLKLADTTSCLDAWNQGQHSPTFYSCDVSGRNMNQQWRLRGDGRLECKSRGCFVPPRGADVHRGSFQPCDRLPREEGLFEVISEETPLAMKIYREELELHRWQQRFPDLADD